MTTNDVDAGTARVTEPQERPMSADATTALAALADRAELDALITKLGRWLDGGVHEPPRELMDERIAVATEGGRAEGIEVVAAQAARNHGAYRTQHAITDRLIELDGGRAQVGANTIVRFDAIAEDGESFTVGGRYRFEAARGEEGWRLTRIEVASLWHAPPGAIARSLAARRSAA